MTTASGTKKSTAPSRDQRLRTIYIFAKRSLALTGAAVTVYFVAGCCLYPEWWFRFLWGEEFNFAYLLDGLKELRDEHFSLLIGIIIAACVVGILTNVFKVYVFRFVDKSTGYIICAVLLVVSVTALIVYHTQSDTYMLDHAFELDLLTHEKVSDLLGRLGAPLHVSPPLDFHYMDKERVDRLYSQLQTSLVEKERTEEHTGSAKGKVGITAGTALNAEVEGEKGVSTKSSFGPADSSKERNCIALMNYIVDHGQAKYYTTKKDWFLDREAKATAEQIQRDRLAPIDLSKLKIETPVWDKPTEEEKREAERKVKQYESELQDELNSLHSYVFIEGRFDETVNGDKVILTERFSTQPYNMTFRVNLPKSSVQDFSNNGKLKLTVFGDVLRSPSNDGYVDIEPIAIY